MQRRRFLAALGAGAAPLAGCAGFGSSAAADERSLGLGDSFETADGRTVTVHDVRVRRMALVRGTVHTDPVHPPDEQFVAADASASDRDLFGEFSVSADGDRLAATANPGLVPPSGEPAGELVGFEVPAPLDADRAAIVLTGPGEEAARWSLDADRLDALENPPEFEVEGFDVPEAVERGEAFDATLTVTNTGSGDGVFLAELGATTLSDTPEIRVEVPASETVVVERTVDPHYSDGDEELPVALNWDADRLRRTVEVAD